VKGHNSVNIKEDQIMSTSPFLSTILIVIIVFSTSIAPAQDNAEFNKFKANFISAEAFKHSEKNNFPLTINPKVWQKEYGNKIDRSMTEKFVKFADSKYDYFAWYIIVEKGYDALIFLELERAKAHSKNSRFHICTYNKNGKLISRLLVAEDEMNLDGYTKKLTLGKTDKHLNISLTTKEYSYLRTKENYIVPRMLADTSLQYKVNQEGEIISEEE
jgi:hypothetical protein